MSTPKQKITFLLGPPGCGKGSQAKKLAQDFGYFRISLGDAFREEIKKVFFVKLKNREVY